MRYHMKYVLAFVIVALLTAALVLVAKGAFAPVSQFLENVAGFLAL